MFKQSINYFDSPIKNKIMTFKHILLEENNGSVTLWLNRPNKRNAFNHEMVLEILQAIDSINQMPENTVMILRGKGEAFCAGADLGWMYNAKNISPDENYAECLDLSRMFYALYSCNKVTIAVVHGVAMGGGAGLVAACDLAVCEDNTHFALSELRIGVVAACISPYLLKKLGEIRTKELVFTSLSFKGRDAEDYGLVNRSVALIGLNSIVQNYISLIQKGSAKARTLSKQLIHSLANETTGFGFIEETAKLLADIRVSPDAQESMGKFLKKG
jgi:methylglutaconyl-CoA hydratase